MQTDETIRVKEGRLISAHLSFVWLDNNMPQGFCLSRLQSKALHRAAAAALTGTESTCGKR